MNEAGYDVRNGLLHLQGEPALIGGKPVEVIFME
jgi:hypothetical protein